MTENKPREWWMHCHHPDYKQYIAYDSEEIARDKGTSFGHKFGEGPVHVIEYSYAEKLRAENEELKRAFGDWKDTALIQADEVVSLNKQLAAVKVEVEKYKSGFKNEQHKFSVEFLKNEKLEKELARYKELLRHAGECGHGRLVMEIEAEKQRSAKLVEALNYYSSKNKQKYFITGELNESIADEAVAEYEAEAQKGEG